MIVTFLNKINYHFLFYQITISTDTNQSALNTFKDIEGATFFDQDIGRWNVGKGNYFG